MSDDVKRTSWTKRVGLALLCCLLLLFVILIFLRVFITTAPGSRFIEKQINMRSFGPIEAVTITGLSGDPLKAISINQITIKDKEGDWLQMENFDMTWKPLAFLKGHIWIQDLSIETTSVLRKPVLNTSESASASNRASPKITLENYTLGSVMLNEIMIGQSLSLTSSGQFLSESNSAASAVIKAARLDVPGELLNLNFTRTEQGAMTGLFDIEGAAGGPIASLLKSPTDVSGSGKIGGDYTEGNATAKLIFGNDEILTANSNWSASQLTARASINLNNWTAFDIGSLQLGPTLETTFKLERDQTKAFLTTLNARGLSLGASGNLPEDGFLPTAVDVNINADKMSSIIKLPENYEVGRALVNGRVDIKTPYGIDARINVEDLITPHGSAAKLTGPLSVSQMLEGVYDFKTDFTASEIITTAALPVNLASQTQLKSSGRFDATERRLSLQKVDLTSGVNQVAGQGTLTMDGLNLDISVKGTAATKAAGSIPEGTLNTEIAVQKTSISALAIIADGVFRPSTSAADPIGGLIGDQLIFKANINPTDDGVTISEVSLIGDNVRAALAGTFNEQLDLSGEAILSAPVNLKSVMIDDGAEASFIVTGSRMDPIFRLDAKFGSITAQHYVLNDARLRTEIKDILSSPKGPVQIDAETAHGALSASTQFTLEPSIFAANDIDLAWGRLTAKGDVKIPSGSIAIGEINLNLPERDGQYARAALTLSDAAGEQGVEFTADAKRISFSGFEFDVVSANAAGTLSSLAGVLKANGQRGDSLISPSFELDAPFTLTKGTGGDANDSFKATILPQVKYGAITVTSNAPTTATFSSGNISLSAPLLISGGTANLEYKRSVMEERLKLEAKLLPVRLIPMPGSLADTRGQISAEIDLYTQLGLPLQGGGVVNLTDWRGFDVDKGDGITGNIRTTIINGKQADITLIANALSGFKVDGNLRVPLSASQTLTGTRLDMAAPLKGQLSTSGSAASIFGLLTPSDAELGGSLLADITIAGTANKPRIEGQAQGDGLQFEMPELGTRLRNGRIKAQFTNESLSVSDLYVADADDGTLSGSGDFKLGDLGRLIGELNITANNFRALDRQDVDAKVKGKLKLVSAPKDATLSGNITLSNVEVKEFVQGTVSVIEIDVDEINRPDQKDVITFDKPETPINLDISLRAPRKIFVRSRGLDVEMAVEAEIQGTVSEPLFYGEAKVVRGGYKLGGKTLEFETGIITFEGDLPSAQVDFTAVTQTQNLEGTLKIGGTVKKPEIELSSSPERPQDEILSALLFDRSATEISALEAAQLAGALAQFSGTGSGFDLLGGVRSAFGINQLSVNVNAEGDAQLVGGRYLAKNVYLEVFSGADTDQTGAIIDWEIRKNIALRSRVQADNDQSVSLKWKRDF